MEQQQQPPTPNSIIQTRQELLHINSKPCLRLAHFLKPSTSLSSIATKPPQPIKQTQNVTHDQHLPIQFPGWRNPQVNYKNWVVSMSQKYAHVWQKAGIYDAVINSTYKISKLNDDLVLEFARNWCPNTKSFVFDWGECSVTLEDLYVLGGYSLLGDSVLTPVENEHDSQRAMKWLMRARSELNKTAAKKVDQSSWMKMFMNKNHEYEHEGFLAYWLSMFVFPHSYHTIGKHVVPIAVHLARGRKIALGPAVLASIYRDLSTIASEKRGGSSGCFKIVPVWAPFQLVQVWIWERFVHLRPKWYILKPVEPRMARWVVDDTAEVFDNVKACHPDWNSFVDKFQWRPYASKVNNNPVFSKFYGNRADEGLSDDELQSFARCLRTCELVGIDCIEQYLPHRVAMQFGFDQEIPADVRRSDSSSQVAWESYVKPIDVTDLFIPSPDTSAGVTAAYFEWRKQRFSSVSSHVSKDKSERFSKAKGVMISQSSKKKKVLKRRKVKEAGDGSEMLSHLNTLKKRPAGFYSDGVPDVPPGFEPLSRKRKMIGESPKSRLNNNSSDAGNLNMPLADSQDDSEDEQDHIPISDRPDLPKILQRSSVALNKSKTSSMMSCNHLQGSSTIKTLKEDNPGMESDLSSGTCEVSLSKLFIEKEQCTIEKSPGIELHTQSENAPVFQNNTSTQVTKTVKMEEGNDICASADDHVLNTGFSEFNKRNEEGLDEQQSILKESKVAVAVDFWSGKQDIKCHEEKEKLRISVERAIELLETKVNLLKAAARARGHKIP